MLLPVLTVAAAALTALTIPAAAQTETVPSAAPVPVPPATAPAPAPTAQAAPQPEAQPLEAVPLGEEVPCAQASGADDLRRIVAPAHHQNGEVRIQLAKPTQDVESVDLLAQVQVEEHGVERLPGREDEAVPG